MLNPYKHQNNMSENFVSLDGASLPQQHKRFKSQKEKGHHIKLHVHFIRGKHHKQSQRKVGATIATDMIGKGTNALLFKGFYKVVRKRKGT